MLTPISNTKLTQTTKQKQIVRNNTPTNAVMNTNYDEYNSYNQRINRENALKNGSLILHKGKELKIFGYTLYKTKDEYEYIANGNETIRYIKNKFGIKDGKIRELNPNIKDDNYQPQKGKSIYLPHDAFD